MLHHQESTERQYALREKAQELGWSEAAIRTLDRDLGKSGAQMAGREDFKTLAADVSVGLVGAVFALEASSSHGRIWTGTGSGSCVLLPKL